MDYNSASHETRTDAEQSETAPDVRVSFESRRKRRKHPKTWYREIKDALRERDGDDCWICKCPTTNGNRTIDHWMPVSRGGSDDIDNLKLAHAECNRRRGNALPEVTHSLHAVRKAAIAMEARKRRDGETRLDPKDDSAGPQDIAQPLPYSSPPTNGAIHD